MKTKSRNVTMVVKCVVCGSKKTLNEIPEEQPMCDKCFMPMEMIKLTTSAGERETVKK